MIEIDRDLKDMIISALRYSIGRKTYITEETCSYIKNHPELIDERVKMVMLNDLEDIYRYYDKNDEVDLPEFLKLKKWLEDLDVKYEINK